MINCTFENGNIASPGLRHVTVGVLALNEKGEILLVKRSDKHSRPNTYTVPGGFLGRDETAEEAAVRELEEESGYTGKIISLFHLNDNPGRPKEDRQNVDIIFGVKITGGSPKHDDEITNIEWFDENSLPKEEYFAFDHRDVILKYFAYQKKPFTIPLVGKI
jgi:8-oxo-dGTP diphosphatase